MLWSQEEVTVRDGDTLWKLAATHLHDPYLWRQIWDLNKNRIANPNRIYPGDYLLLPGGRVPEQSSAPNKVPPQEIDAWEPLPVYDRTRSLSEFDWKRLEETLYKMEKHTQASKTYDISSDLRMRAGILLQGETRFTSSLMNFSGFFPGGVWPLGEEVPSGIRVFLVEPRPIALLADTLSWANIIAEGTVETENHQSMVRIQHIYDVPEAHSFWIPAKQKFAPLQCQYNVQFHQGPRMRVVGFENNNLQSAGDFLVVAAGNKQRLQPGDILASAAESSAAEWLASMIVLNVYDHYSIGMLLATDHPLETQKEYVFQQHLKRTE